MSDTLAADRTMIADLLARYGRAADSHDPPAVAALFADDGVFDNSAQPPLNGRAAIEEFFTAWISSTDPASRSGLHFFGPPLIDVDGDSATATCMMQYLDRTEAGGRTITYLARYDDELVRRDGRWSFARRSVVPLVD